MRDIYNQPVNTLNPLGGLLLVHYRLKSLSLAILVLSLLMTEFYQKWQQNPNKAVALRNAMLKTMKKHPSPVNWATFTLIAESK